MAVEVRYKGRLGNCLFQYALGRLIAERLNYELIAEPLDEFELTKETVTGINYSDSEVVFVANDIDTKGIYSGKYSGQRIILDGYFQVYDYFKDDLEKIRKWFDLSHVEPLFHATEDDLVINWRQSDWLIPNRIWRTLPANLVERVILKRQWNKIYLVTESPDEEGPQRLRNKYKNLEIHHGAPLEDMRSVQSAHTLLISSSTFSWWGALLSDAEKIYFPDLYNWSEFAVYFPGKDIPSENLFPHDQNRFVKYPESKIERVVRNLTYVSFLDTYFKKLYYQHFKLRLHKRIPPSVLHLRQKIIQAFGKLTG